MIRKFKRRIKAWLFLKGFTPTLAEEYNHLDGAQAELEFLFRHFGKIGYEVYTQIQQRE